MRLDVVTPRGQVVSDDVDEVTAPGVLGEFGVLPGHIPFLTGMRPGVLTYRKGDTTGRVAVAAGFIEVAGTGDVHVLADLGAAASAIDVAAARKELADVDQKLGKLGPDDAAPRKDLEAQRAWAQARIDAAGATSAH